MNKSINDIGRHCISVLEKGRTVGQTDLKLIFCCNIAGTIIGL